MKTSSKKKVILAIAIIFVLASIAATVLIIVLDKNKNHHIIVVNKSAYNGSEFWEVAYAGMIEAATAFEIEFEYMSPRHEYEIEVQKEVILNAIEKSPDAIVLVASDYYEIAPYAKMIVENDIKLILLDSDVDVSYDYKSTYIGTNSIKAGIFLGEKAKMNTTTKNKNAIILAHYIGVQTSDDRENGIKQGYGEENILDTYSCKSDEFVAYDTTKLIISEDDSVVNIFCTNENVTIGAAKAIEEMGLEDRIDIYGFDGSKEHVKYLEKGILNYTIIQSPYQMGYLSIENAVAILNNEKVSQFIETDYLLIDAKNMYDIGYREILFPFIK